MNDIAFSLVSAPFLNPRSLSGVISSSVSSVSRVVLSKVAGVLYEWSKRRDSLPLGALPYLVGATFPLVGVAVPFWLYFRSIEAKVRSGSHSFTGTIIQELLRFLGVSSYLFIDRSVCWGLYQGGDLFVGDQRGCLMPIV